MFLFMICSIFFHFSSIIFIGIFILYSLRNVKIIKYLIPFIIITAIWNYQKLIPLAVEILGKYSNYFRNARTMQTGNGVYFLWGLVSIISVCVIYNQKQSSKVRIEAVFPLLYVSANVVGLTFNYAERLGIYFLPFVIVLYDNFAKSLTYKFLQQIFTVIISIIYIGYFLLSASSAQYNYSFFWK